MHAAFTLSVTPAGPANLHYPRDERELGIAHAINLSVLTSQQPGVGKSDSSV
jgi:hypothetical protein